MMLKGCMRCRLFEAKDPKPPLVNISSTTQPMDLLHVDLVGMETTVSTSNKPVTQKALVVIDHFSRYVQAYKIENKTALATAKCLYDNYFRHFGFPRSLMSDRGTEFCNKILNSLCVYLGIKKIRTTAYHPQSNGSVERTHQSIASSTARPTLSSTSVSTSDTDSSSAASGEENSPLFLRSPSTVNGLAGIFTSSSSCLGSALALGACGSLLARFTIACSSVSTSIQEEWREPTHWNWLGREAPLGNYRRILALTYGAVSREKSGVLYQRRPEE